MNGRNNECMCVRHEAVGTTRRRDHAPKQASRTSALTAMSFVGIFFGTVPCWSSTLWTVWHRSRSNFFSARMRSACVFSCCSRARSSWDWSRFTEDRSVALCEGGKQGISQLPSYY